MKRFVSTFWIVICTLSAFQNGRVYAGKCIFCKFGTILTPTNSSATTKLSTVLLKSKHTMTVSSQNSILVKTSLDHHTENDLMTTSSINSTDDLVKFISQTSLTDLSPDDKESLVMVITSVYGHTMDPLPNAMVVNMVSMFACSPKLFSALPQQCLHSALSILTVNRCALCEVPKKDTAMFLSGLLSLSPGVLNSIPRAIFLSILGTVSSPEFFIELPHSSTVNLITALSMSKSAVNCLPMPTLLSLLTFMSKSPKDLMITLPPSTIFGFLDGLFDTLNSSPFLVNTIPTSVLVAVVSPVMTSRMLSVMPIASFDLLFSVLGSSQALSKDLPITNIISMINISINSPKILSSLNPNNVAKMLSTVATCPSIFDSLPSNLMRQLLDSITVYLPSSLACITANEYSLLFGKKNT